MLPARFHRTVLSIVRILEALNNQITQSQAFVAYKAFLPSPKITQSTKDTTSDVTQSTKDKCDVSQSIQDNAGSYRQAVKDKVSDVSQSIKDSAGSYTQAGEDKASDVCTSRTLLALTLRLLKTRLATSRSLARTRQPRTPRTPAIRQTL